MPRLNIIILERVSDDNMADSYKYAMWADVPAARQSYYASSANVSVWVNASSADNANLQSGAVVELVETRRLPTSLTIAQIEIGLQNRWSTFQSYVTSHNPWQRYGTTWDGTTWTLTNNG